jgi:hypothetical protein
MSSANIWPFEFLNILHRWLMKIIKCVVPELILVAHQTTLRMVKESIHNNRYEVRCWSSNYVTSLCIKQAAGSSLLFEETDHAELVQTLC